MSKQRALLARCAALLEAMRRAHIPVNVWDDYLALRDDLQPYLIETKPEEASAPAS